MATTALEMNAEFLRAMQLLDRGSNVFVTGKAGTGKSTLLRHFLQTTPKKVAVAAPTGIAALNVGGVTIHRLFGFRSTVTPEFVQSKEYFPRKYSTVLRELEVLVIDEVSMVRADLFDCVAIALARYGPHRDRPFGGVQLVLVGDPYQLPPVVTDPEEEHFRTRYATPYFFSADSFREFPNEIVQLEKVYRQRDDRFVSLLNDIRTGIASDAVIEALNARCQPDFETPDDEFWVTLTTTNARADLVNDRRLARLPTDLLTSQAVSQGDLEGFDRPNPESLDYKVGAQVMLLTNDPMDRWVNGTLGVVLGSQVKDGAPSVMIGLENGRSVVTSPFTWAVTKPSSNGGVLTYETVGTYTQLPFKLAWAVTIHKSQGKTLDKVVVDLYRGAFAEGQLYVALSRCTSLEGLVLRNQVKLRDVRVEREVTRFLARSAGIATAAESYAFLGILATGYGQYDRIFELGVVVEQGGRQVAEFSTLVNPNRDVGEAATQHGVSASDLSLAPTLAEAWPLIARQLAGCVLVCEAMSLVQTMVERELKQAGFVVSLGLGIDLQEMARNQASAAGAAVGSASERARFALEQFKRLNTANEVTLPYQPEAEAMGAGALCSRVPARLRTGHLRGEVAYADLVALAADHAEQTQTWQAWLSGLGGLVQIAPVPAASIHQDALDRLVQRAHRDGVVSAPERERLAAVAGLFGIPEPTFDDDPAGPSIAEVLAPGARVCFTGSACDGSGTQYERSDMERVALSVGLEPVGSVTKTKCDVLVAADTSSMSGKAKKAREFGKPIFGAGEFLKWAQDAGAK